MFVATNTITSEGKFLAGDAEKVRDYLQRVAGKDVIITIQEINERRTNKQLSYWFGVVVDAIYQNRLKDAGYSWVEAKAMCKRKAMGMREVTINGKVESFDRSLTDADVDTLEMLIITWRLEQWAEEIGVVLPQMVTDAEAEDALNKKQQKLTETE